MPKRNQNAADVFAFDVAVNDFERALALMDELGLDDPAQRWTILESLGWWHKILANTLRAVAHFEQALDQPSTPDWQPARYDKVRAHCGAAMALLTAGDTTKAETHLQAALEQVDAEEDAAEYADVLYNMAQVRWHRNEYQAAFELAQRSLDIAERLKKPEAAARAIALCQCFNGALEFQTGDWDQAEKALRESIELYCSIGAASGEALACQQLGVLQTAKGQLEEAWTTLGEGAVVAERAVMRAHCLTRIYAAMARNRLEAADVEAADQALVAGLAMSKGHGHCATCDALLLPVAVSVRLAQEDLAAAGSFCHQLDQAAQEYASRTWLAMAQQAAGEVAAAGGDLATAVTCYRAAYEKFSAANYEYEAARCLASLATLYRRRNREDDKAKAQPARSEAHQIFQQLGAI